MEIHNFRSYRQVTVLFGPEINFIVGPNASGKSNLLEALAYLGYARSFRWHEDRQLINWGAESFLLKGELQSNFTCCQLKITYTPGKKEAFINDAHYRLSDYLGTYPVISFGPDDLYLLKGPPALRRQFLDREISQIDRQYCHQLRSYRHILLQRNRLLRQIKDGQAHIFELDPWNEQLITLGLAIVKRRREFVDSLGETISKLFKDFIDKSADLVFSYKTAIENTGEFQRLLEKSIKAEINSGATLYGPHRDDLNCTLNGYEIRYSASQGQQRAALLTFKLAEVTYFNSVLKERPGVILDDVFSELDLAKRIALLSLLRDKGQVFLSLIDLKDIEGEVPENSKVIKVEELRG
ncbi:MAG: replication and repair protein RecF [Clostridia bacterium]|nr:replication and repair protein RecF [Clostridia bacterium]